MRKSKIFTGLAFAIVALLVATPIAFAQSTRGDISGTVSADDGSALPGVSVSVTGPTLPGDRSAVTDENGNFRVASLPPGVYTVTFGLDSFQSIEQQNVAVTIGGTARLAVEMTSTFTDELVVTSERPVVDTSTQTSGVNLDETFFNELAVGRDFSSIARVAPGAQQDACNAANCQTSFYGSTSAENAYYIDGVNTTGIELGQQGQELNFEFIQEVQVKTGSYSAEYGRATGGLVNVITKSGGNEFTGDVFGYFDEIQNSLSGAADIGPLARATQIREFSKQDLGLDLGGYLVKDKLWFFAAYNDVDNTDDVAAVDDFGSVLPGAPNRGDIFPTDTKSQLWAGKLTWAANSGHSFYGSIFGDPTDTSGFLPGESLAGTPLHFTGVVETGATDYAINYDGVVSDKVILNARFSSHEEKSEQFGAGANAVGYIDNTDPLGDGTTVWGFGDNIAGFGFYQNQPELSRENINADATFFVDDFGGSHEFKLGYEFEDIAGQQDNFNGGTGQRIYRFTCVDSDTRDCQGSPYYYRHRFYTGDNTLDPETLVAGNIQVPLSVGIKTENDAIYLQDTWRPSSNLTINAGVRLETQQLFNHLGTVQADIDDNLAPRVGFTLDPTKQGKAKIFGHYGLYYETIPMDIVIRSFGGEIQIFTYNVSDSPNDVANDPTVRNSRFLGGGISRVDPGVSGQYLDEIVFGGEWEVKKSWSVGVKYINRDLKDVIEDALAADGDYFIGNPGQGLMAGTYDLGYAFGYNDTLHQLNKPSRTYEAVEFTTSKRLTNNFQFLASALWSELKGDYDGTFQLSTGQLDPNLNSAFDYFDFSVNNTGLLSNDREWQLKFDGIYQFNNGLNGGLSAFYRTGTPVTAMGYSEAYSNWEFYLSERGAFGRVDDAYEMDLHLGYPLAIGGEGREIHFLVDIFNLLDAQTETLREVRYTPPREDYEVIGLTTGVINPPVTPGSADRPATSAAFNTGRAWTNPRRVRLGVRFSF
ncbi:MAG: TonB-dependent receptor [Acidobacteriota bacterium]|nr:TonB-dependent receptor [Acidobacteriota bacterium]